jgi:hypothetical protein
MANTTVESLIQKFAESKGTGKERPGKMIDNKGNIFKLLIY